MLSDRERQVLREVEQALAVDDPRLAARMRRWPTRRRGRAGVVAIVLAIGVAVLCVALSAAGPAFVAIGVAGALLLHRRWRRRRASGVRRPRWLRWTSAGGDREHGVGEW